MLSVLLISVFLSLISGIEPQQPLPPQQLQVCLRDVEEDICPQREGFDTECDTRCGQLYPMRIGSGCRTRQTGQLLSFFGIRSFVCTCHLSPIACANPQFAVHPYHTLVVQQHSILTPVPVKESSNCDTVSFSCRDPSSCGWQFSKEFDWFSGRANGNPKPRESPEDPFVAGTSHQGATWATVSTCDAMCSTTSVNLTARVWRPPTVVVELCFKEKDTTMCAPVHATNGHLINEIIPETNYFQIMLRFSNVTAGEMIMVNDLSLNYQPCHQATTKILPATNQTQLRTVPINLINKGVQHRMCQNGECNSPTLHSSSATTKMCVGRAGLAYCRQKCKAMDASDTSARCLRQRENPLVKKCICHVRRSPIKRIDGPTESTVTPSTTVVTEPMSTAEMEMTDVTTETASVPMPECEETLCNFEKDSKCGWADLRMLSRHFNNISVAMKKGDENRYGISRLEPRSYSGLLYKSALIGPISMSIDVFPSHEIDVRICVQNLRKCQTQSIAPRSWNRISAKIKVQSTEKIFVLFFNNSMDTKSIAIDNIVVKNGACQS